MKKLLMAATIVSAVAAVHVNAATYTVSSNITDIGMTISLDPGVYQPKAAGVTDTLAFSGSLDITVTGGSYTIDSGDIFLNGVTSLNAAGADVILTFLDASGAASNNGVVIDSGMLDVNASTGPLPPVDFSVDQLNMTNSGVYDGVNYAGLPLGAGVVNPDGSITIALLGLPAAPEGAALADVTAAIAVFGIPAAIFLGGTITLTPTEIPLPAAAWLFGSGLIGLAGVARKRKLAAV